MIPLFSKSQPLLHTLIYSQYSSRFPNINPNLTISETRTETVLERGGNRERTADHNNQEHVRPLRVPELDQGTDRPVLPGIGVRSHH